MVLQEQRSLGADPGRWDFKPQEPSIFKRQISLMARRRPGPPRAVQSAGPIPSTGLQFSQPAVYRVRQFHSRDRFSIHERLERQLLAIARHHSFFSFFNMAFPPRMRLETKTSALPAEDVLIFGIGMRANLLEVGMEKIRMFQCILIYTYFAVIKPH